eukprot:TRINITY_DN9091_c0_g1_i4.p1 TRINITY_DN9091_c0_g1~~TRINITY_DN9091_c0_g1_i4.p1  ORF type:complete len:1221 (-),score=265.68 TRINITY_DN9091_c0_g1_i4:392-4054(-)
MTASRSRSWTTTPRATRPEFLAAWKRQHGERLGGASTGDVHLLVAGTSKMNVPVIDAAQTAGIANIHTSGGNPAMWKASNTFAYGMHLPFIWYTRGPIRIAERRGLKSIAIIRSFAHGFSKASCLAAIAWAQEVGLKIVGPSVSWCQQNAAMTGQCRVVNNRCVCGEQADVDGLGLSYKIEEGPTFYEMDEGKIDAVEMGKVDGATTNFVRGMIKDMHDQDELPDIILNFATEWHNVHNALYTEGLEIGWNPKMLLGWQGGTVPTWAAVSDDAGAEILNATHGYWSIGFGQWHKAMQFSDPLFGSNDNVVRLFAEANDGKFLDYDTAGAIASGVVIYTALSKYTNPGFDQLPLPALRDALRGAVGQMNDETMWGPVNFNRFNQNSGRGTAAWQIIPQEDADGNPTGEPQQLCVLPSDAAEATLVIPFPSWQSRFGCPAGLLNTGSHCEACPSGQFSDAKTAGLRVTTCAQCPAGVGTLENETGAMTCRQCPGGQSQDGDMHRGICTDCKPGSYRAAGDAGERCSLCHEGTFANRAGAAACEACPFGTFQRERGHESCQCNISYYKNPADTTFGGSTMECKSCAAVLSGSTTEFPGSTRGDECMCGVGSYLHASGQCRSCSADFPEGSVDCSGFGSRPMLRPGFMTLHGQQDVYTCFGDGTSCPGGAPVGTEVCSAGGSEISCSKCKDGYRYDKPKGKCAECQGPAATIFLVLCCLLVLFLPIKLRPIESSYSERSMKRLLGVSCMQVPLSQLFDALQLSMILNRSSISFPHRVHNVFSGLGAVFDLNLFGVECILGGDKDTAAFRYVLLVNLLPAIVLMFIALVTLPTFLSKTFEEKRFPHYVDAANMALGMLVTFFITIINFATNLVFATFEHPGTGIQTLEAFPYLRTTDEQVTNMTIVASCALAIWCVGTFLLVICLLHFNGSTTFRRCTVMLRVRYQDDKSAWICLELCLKLCVAISVSIFSTADAQLEWIAMTYVVYLALVTAIQPYRFKRHWLSDIVLTVGKIAILVFSSSRLLRERPQNVGILSALVLTYVAGAGFVSWSVVDFALGKASDPSRDLEIFAALRSKIERCMPAPRCLSELAPDSSWELKSSLQKAAMDPTKRMSTMSRLNLNEVPDIVAENHQLKDQRATLAEQLSSLQQEMEEMTTRSKQLQERPQHKEDGHSLQETDMPSGGDGTTIFQSEIVIEDMGEEVPARELTVPIPLQTCKGIAGLK